MTLWNRLEGAFAGFCFVRLMPVLALDMEYELGRPRPKTKFGRAMAQPSDLFWVIMGWKGAKP